MKKFLIVLILIAVIIALFFLFRSCDAEKKTQEESAEELTEETFDVDMYRDSFVYANTEFACEIVQNPELAENEEEVKQILDKAYKKYGFPTDDDAMMIEILDKYENNSEVIEEIKTNVSECKQL